MNQPVAREITAALVWFLLAAGLLVPVGLAAANPLQSSREPLWIFGGMAGVVALALLLLQPMLAADLLPGASTPVVILSSLGGHERANDTVAAFLVKPVKPSSLHDTLATVLSGQAASVAVRSVGTGVARTSASTSSLDAARPLNQGRKCVTNT